MSLGFKELFNSWADKNANKKLGDAIAKGNVKGVQEYLKRKPQKFHYLLWGTHPDTPGQKVPQGAFGNPVELAHYVGRPELVPMLVAAGYPDPKANKNNATYVR